MEELKEEVNEIWIAYFNENSDLMKLVSPNLPEFSKDIDTIDKYLNALEDENKQLKEQLEQLKKQIKP